MTTSDLEDRLHADLPRLADLLTGEATTEPVAPIPLVARDRRRTARVVTAVAVAAAVVAALVVALVAVTRGQVDRPARPTGVVTTEPGWSTLPPSPLGPRAGVVAVWTGREVLVWGGHRGEGIPLAFQSGAAYDPTTRTWRPIADNAWGHPAALGAWTGESLVIVAKNGGAEYDPATDTWHDLPLLPSGITPDVDLGSFGGVVWTGHDVLGLVRGTDRVAVARLDRAAGTWSVGTSQVAAPPALDSSGSVVWTGDELVYWAGANQGWAYRPGIDTWFTLPALPFDATGLRSAVSTVGGDVVVAYARGVGDATTVGVARLLDGAWVVDGEVAVPGFRDPVPTVAGRTVFVLDGAGTATPLRFDLDAESATRLAGYPLTPGNGVVGVGTGDGLFVWGGLPAGTPASFPNPAPAVPDAAWCAAGEG